MRKMLILSLAFNALLIIAGLIAVQKLGGWHFVFYKMNNRGLAGEYEHRKNLFEKLPQNLSKDSVKVVFLGDSLTEQCEWSELFQDPSIINRGIAGDHTLGILGRLDAVLFYQPEKIYLMVGVNDLFYHPPQTTIKNYEKLVHLILQKSSSTELVLQSILPVNNRVKNITLSNQTIQEVNVAIEKIALENNLKFLHLFPLFEDSDGNLNKKFTQDGIHLNGDGYLIWKKAIIEL